MEQPTQEIAIQQWEESRASSAGETEENGSGNVTTPAKAAATANAAAAAPAAVSAPAVIFKPQLQNVKYDEFMTPQQWFQDWERMLLVAYKVRPMSEKYQLACMENAPKR